MQQSRFYQNQARPHVNQEGRPFAPPPHQNQAYNPATAWNPAPLPPQIKPQYFQEPGYNHPFQGPQQAPHSPGPQSWQSPQNSPFVHFGDPAPGPAQQSWTPAKRNSTKDKTAVYNFIERFKKDWTIEELNFSMNKISMAGLIFGLMFLGSLFFLIGFLVAVNLYDKKPDPMCVQPKMYMPTQGAVLSGQAGTAVPMGSPMPQTPRMAHPHAGLGMQQGGRMPTSMQQGQPMPYQGQGRIPSFQMR
ncbi:MAG: hypothetical protein COY39_05495 [Alphaproteobacteria bacterium CG_4_10_14_0_8_um_filter_37_21]|nr:MAG: hypothetical protein COY39_05495 [Alphaproteobacteria bacterium CG_4_10_14_0_8_um_filter_37_21]